jgi:adenosine kinase
MYQELIDHYHPSYIAGGATQNSMRVAQWMLSSLSMPGQVAFMGSVGKDDANGKLLQDCAERDGVTVHYYYATTTTNDTDDLPKTGTCAALIVDKERCLVANLAAANAFHVSHLDTPKAKELVDAAQVYYSAGFFLTVSPESFQRVAELFVAQNKVVCLNLSAPFLVDFFAEPMQMALEYADFLFANESEAAAYGTKHGLGTELHAIALAVAASPFKKSQRGGDGHHPYRTVVFTQGSQPTIVAANGVVTEYPVPALEPDLIVDTNGAGDAFVGGFLSQLVQHKEIEECVRAGHWAARHIIQVSGTTLDQACDFE